MCHKETLRRSSKLVAACVVLGMVLSLLGCREVLTSVRSGGDNIQTYVIKQEDHYSQPAVASVFSGTVMRFKARFDNSAAYEIEPSKQGDTNKLYGFSDCGTQHQDNSFRIGWSWNLDEQHIDLRAYVYKNRERRSEVFSSTLPNRWDAFEIRLSDDRRSYVISHTNDGGEQKVVTLERGCDSGSFVGYRLYPYFGGTTPAPHNVSIRIEEL